MGPPWGAFYQITLTSCFKSDENPRIVLQRPARSLLQIFHHACPPGSAPAVSKTAVRRVLSVIPCVYRQRMRRLICRWNNRSTASPVRDHQQRDRNLSVTQQPPNVTRIKCRTSPPDIYSARIISLPTWDIPPAVKAKIWKLALTHTPDPNRPTRREIFWKLA